MPQTQTPIVTPIQAPSRAGDLAHGPSDALAAVREQPHRSLEEVERPGVRRRRGEGLAVLRAGGRALIQCVPQQGQEFVPAGAAQHRNTVDQVRVRFGPG